MKNDGVDPRSLAAMKVLESEVSDRCATDSADAGTAGAVNWWN
jgi:hypothetical protein